MVRRRILAIAIMACVTTCLTLTGCSQGAQGSSSPQAAAPAAAQRQAAPDVISAEAVVAPYREADLSFKIGGQVIQVLVSEGDTVTQGQELIRLDTRDLDSSVRRAEAELKSAEAKLAKAKAGSRTEEIAAADAALATAQANLGAAEKATDVVRGELGAAQAAVKTAESAVNIAQGNLAGAQAAFRNAQANLDKLVAGPTQREIQIAEKELEQAKNNLWTVQKMRDVAAVNEEQVATSESRAQIAQLRLDEVKAGARPEDIAIAKAQVAQAASEVQTMQGQLAQARTGVAQAQTRALIAEGRVAQVKAQAESGKAEVQQAQAQLDKIKAGSLPEDIIVAEAAVAAARAALEEARDGLADAMLSAPFDGTVGAILINEGELVAPQKPVVTLGDLSHWRVRTEDLGEAEVSSVRLGQEATVTVDALGGKKFKGTVVEVATIASDRGGDKVYTVKIDLDAGAESGLRWGMSAFMESKVP